ncbi:uncharacterized protein LOC132193442 [Neocloeon triangulifer]|uniref:uncharacterized protein LOC132193442 n=1 Tax=Neocloeon triangulifer TaxID=2078957 RepID=UPI00286F1EE2|nr:uncharacterized protein LOC132193442 [Neocloeon triangulifer]
MRKLMLLFAAAAALVTIAAAQEDFSFNAEDDDSEDEVALDNVEGDALSRVVRRVTRRPPHTFTTPRRPPPIVRPTVNGPADPPNRADPNSIFSRPVRRNQRNWYTIPEGWALEHNQRRFSRRPGAQRFSVTIDPVNNRVARHDLYRPPTFYTDRNGVVRPSIAQGRPRV